MLVDGAATHSRITPVERSPGAKSARSKDSHPATSCIPSEAFLAERALQCGYCTPGMIMGAVGLLAEPEPAESEILTAMEGHICRCGSYPRIVRAIRRAAAGMKEQKP